MANIIILYFSMRSTPSKQNSLRWKDGQCPIWCYADWLAKCGFTFQCAWCSSLRDKLSNHTVSVQAFWRRFTKKTLQVIFAAYLLLQFCLWGIFTPEFYTIGKIICNIWHKWSQSYSVITWILVWSMFDKGVNNALSLSYGSVINSSQTQSTWVHV